MSNNGLVYSESPHMAFGQSGTVKGILLLLRVPLTGRYLCCWIWKVGERSGDG